MGPRRNVPLPSLRKRLRRQAHRKRGSHEREQTQSDAGQKRNRPDVQASDVSSGAFGLHGLNTEVVVDNTASFRGMVKKVLHLVEVEEVNE